MEDEHPANDANEHSESAETHQEQHLAMGEQPSQEQSGSGIEEGNNKAQQLEQRTNESSVDKRDMCVCTTGKTAVSTKPEGDGKVRCRLCGKVVEQNIESRSSNGLLFAEVGPTAPPVGQTEPSAGLDGTFANGLPFLPCMAEMSLEDCLLSTGESERNAIGKRVPPPLAEQQEKTPHHGKSSSPLIQYYKFKLILRLKRSLKLNDKSSIYTKNLPCSFILAYIISVSTIR